MYFIGRQDPYQVERHTTFKLAKDKDISKHSFPRISLFQSQKKTSKNNNFYLLYRTLEQISFCSENRTNLDIFRTIELVKNSLKF